MSPANASRHSLSISPARWRAPAGLRVHVDPQRGSGSALTCNQTEKCDYAVVIVRHSPYDRVLILLGRPAPYIIAQQIVALGQKFGASHIDHSGFFPVLRPPLDGVHVRPVLLVLRT